MNVIYTSDNEKPTLLPLATLILNFNQNDGWKYHACAEDMRHELSSRGWYEGVHDNGHYLVFLPTKLGCVVHPELEDAAFEAAKTTTPHATDYSILPDHREPRQSMYFVMRAGQIEKHCYTRSDAVEYIETTTGEDFADDGDDE
jgi:hypothetical protein